MKLLNLIYTNISLLLLLCFLSNPFLLIQNYYNNVYDLDYGLTIIDGCSNFKDEVDRVYCLHKNIKDKFNYVSVTKIISEEELLSNGGDCKAWSFYYGSLLNKMNVTYKYITTNNHIYVMAYGDDYYCTLDMDIINCGVSAS